jgi:hypothetical protein
VEMGWDAQTRGDAYVRRAGVGPAVTRHHRSRGLTLTHEMFSAKVESSTSTAELRISEAATTGSGGSLVF